MAITVKTSGGGGTKLFIDDVKYKNDLNLQSLILSFEKSTLPYVFYEGDAIVYNNQIHILGGSDNYTKHYVYNGSTWTSESTLPYVFYEGSAIVYNDKIHILGRYSSSTAPRTNHYAYNGSTWTNESTLPYEFYEGSAIMYNNQINILGGYNKNEHYAIDATLYEEV